MTIKGRTTQGSKGTRKHYHEANELTTAQANEPMGGLKRAVNEGRRRKEKENGHEAAGSKGGLT